MSTHLLWQMGKIYSKGTQDTKIIQEYTPALAAGVEILQGINQVLPAEVERAIQSQLREQRRHG